jgi:hypothetical protein
VIALRDTCKGASRVRDSSKGGISFLRRPYSLFNHLPYGLDRREAGERLAQLRIKG